MPKGTKTCINPECLKPNGPRSFKCKHCGTDFLFDGEVRKPKVVKVATVDDIISDEFIFEMHDFFVPVENYHLDPHNIKSYNGEARCWQTPDGMYRLRYAKHFMGVALEAFDTKPYILLKRTKSQTAPWTIIKRFSTMQSSLKAMDMITKGEYVLPPEGYYRETKRRRFGGKRKKKTNKVK